MSFRSQWLVVVIVLGAEVAALAQAPTTFRKRHPSDLIRLASYEPRARREPVPSQAALYRWRQAIQSLRPIAALVGDERFAEAEQELAKVLPQLSAPYNRELDTVINQLKYFHEATVNNPHVLHAHTKFDQPEWLHLQCKVLAEICLKLGGREQAFAYVKRAVEAKGPGQEDSKWIWEVLNQYNLTTEQVQELKRIVTNPDSRTECDRELSFRKPDDVQYRFEYHQPKSLAVNLAELDDLHRRLETILSADEKRDIYLTTVFVLHCGKCTAEREAWQSKVLLDLHYDQEACGSVLLDRGREAYIFGQLEAAFAHFDKIRRKYPQSSSYAWAMSKLGAIEQHRRNYPAAIANYRALFARVEEDRAREVFDRDSLPYDLLHDSAVGLSHCYEATGDFVSALEWAELSERGYHGWPRSTCLFGSEEEGQKFALWKARLLSRNGQPEEALELLEPLLWCSGYSGAIPIEAAQLYVAIHLDQQQFDLLPARLEAVRAKLADDHPVRRHAERWMRLAQAVAKRDAQTLWRLMQRQDGKGAFDTLFCPDYGLDERKVLLRHKAMKALVSIPEAAGPILFGTLVAELILSVCVRGDNEGKQSMAGNAGAMQVPQRLAERSSERLVSAGRDASEQFTRRVFSASRDEPAVRLHQPGRRSSSRSFHTFATSACGRSSG